MYSIGMFSQICRVTPKTLRHYDEIGLLRPAASTGSPATATIRPASSRG